MLEKGQNLGEVTNVNTNPGQASVIQVGGAGFKSEVLRSDRPVLVAFRNSWSRPRQILEAVMDEAVTACAGFVKVDADDNLELSLWYEIQSIPTLLYFLEGTVRARTVGTVSKKAVLSQLRLISHGGDATKLPPNLHNKL